VSTTDPVALLRRARQGRPRSESDELERCELCSDPIPSEHGHLVDLQRRSLLCACRGCHLLFAADGAGGARYRAVPQRYLALEDVELSSADWDSLQIPVGVAFFFYNSGLGRLAAFYPGPAGATESLLPLEGSAITERIAAVGLLPDVEAVLVRRQPGEGASECYLVPIDACYELVGTLRRLWRGFDGGGEARRAIAEVFARIAARSGRPGDGAAR